MSKHTPGPWQICGARGCSCRMIWGDSGEVCIGVAHSAHWKSAIGDPWPKDEMADANARLIAAAPDLLAACKAYIAFENYELPSYAIGSTATTEEKVQEYREHMRKESDIRQQTQEAIAKAGRARSMST